MKYKCEDCKYCNVIFRTPWDCSLDYDEKKIVNEYNRSKTYKRIKNKNPKGLDANVRGTCKLFKPAFLTLPWFAQLFSKR